MTYPYIRAYNTLMAPMPSKYFMDKALQAAAATNAPEDAVFQKADGSWVTISQVQDPQLRERIENTANQAHYQGGGIMEKYRMQVNGYPTETHPEAPYYWAIKEYVDDGDDTGWCIHTSGRAQSPSEAAAAASEVFLKLIRTEV